MWPTCAGHMTCSGFWARAERITLCSSGGSCRKASWTEFWSHCCKVNWIETSIEFLTLRYFERSHSHESCSQRGTPTLTAANPTPTSPTFPSWTQTSNRKPRWTTSVRYELISVFAVFYVTDMLRCFNPVPHYFHSWLAGCFPLYAFSESLSKWILPCNSSPELPSGVQGGSSSAQEEAGWISEEAEGSGRGVTPAVRPRVHYPKRHDAFDVNTVCVRHVFDTLTISESVYVISIFIHSFYYAY